MSIEKLKKLRAKTGISLAECKNALKESDNDLEKAGQILKNKGLEFAAKKGQRQVRAGIIHSYIHINKKVGVLLDLKCETDFVAKNQEFQNLANEICMQIAAMNPEDKQELLKQAWIKDESKKIKGLIAGSIAKLGENIVVEKFIRYEI